MIKKSCLSLILLTLSACTSVAPPCSAPVAGDIVYVTEEGWHVEIGIPVDELDSPLAFYRDVFPGARVIMFGYGKKTFFVAPAGSISEYILGPVPGPALIQAVALNVTPQEAYPPEDTIVLALPPGGLQALSKFIWNDLSKDAAGKPVVVSRSTDPDGLFYAAESEYNLLHTCNTWITDALQAAGEPITSAGVIFAYQAMDRAAEASANRCEINNRSE